MLKNIHISTIQIENRHRVELGDLELLAQSILEQGLLQPIGITKDRRLIFGERRLCAVRDILKKKTILTRILDVNSILLGEYAENEIRKDFTPSERVAIAKALQSELPERRGNPSIRQKIDELNGRTDAYLAGQAGFGNRQTFRQASKVVENGSEKLVQAMDSGKVSISASAILADVDEQQQQQILKLDKQAILQVAKEIKSGSRELTLSNGIAGHERAPCGLSDDWITPEYILNALDKFALDPCASNRQPWATAKRHLTNKENGLSVKWSGRIWLNPPYGEETAIWMSKLANHGNGVALVFARTETQWFFDSVWSRADALLFLKGRVSFHRPDGSLAGSSGAPSVLIAYGERNGTCLRNCGLEGKFVQLME